MDTKDFIASVITFLLGILLFLFKSQLNELKKSIFKHEVKIQQAELSIARLEKDTINVRDAIIELKKYEEDYDKKIMGMITKMTSQVNKLDRTMAAFLSVFENQGIKINIGEKPVVVSQ